MSIIALADRYAAAKKALDAAKAELDAVSAEIKAAGAEIQFGATCDVVFGLHERSSFSSKRAKEFLSDDQVALCTDILLVETLRIKAHGIAAN